MNNLNLHFTQLSSYYNIIGRQHNSIQFEMHLYIFLLVHFLHDAFLKQTTH